jgi:hypothetical protein
MLLGHPATDGVEVVLWPEESARRDELAASGSPAFLLVPPGEAAPLCAFLEEWTRVPAPMDDVYARLDMLRGRAACTSVPVLRPGGVVVHGSGAVAVPTGQLSLAKLLIERFGTVVQRKDLAAAYEASGGKATDEALKAAVFRLGQRLTEVGLVLRTIRGKGFLLEGQQGCRASRRRP